MGQLVLNSGTEGGIVVPQRDRQPSFFVWQGKSGSSVDTQDESNSSLLREVLLSIAAVVVLQLYVASLYMPEYRTIASGAIAVFLVAVIVMVCLEYRNVVVVDFPGARDIWLEEEIAEEQAKTLRDYEVELTPLYCIYGKSDNIFNTTKTFNAEELAARYVFYGYTANGSMVLQRLEQVYGRAMRATSHLNEWRNLWLNIADYPEAIEAVSIFYLSFLPLDHQPVDEHCTNKTMRIWYAEALQQLDAACEDLVQHIIAIRSNA